MRNASGVEMREYKRRDVISKSDGQWNCSFSMFIKIEVIDLIIV